MADVARRRRENVEGDLYVDETCIDCDTCRWMAPATFDRANDKSRVHTQPGDEATRLAALQALVSCPTASIGTTRTARDLKAAMASLPLPVDGPVHCCGWTSEASYGATSYLIVREAGNVLVDSPRFARPLVDRLHELGGVAFMLLTHEDDVADHARFAREFGCTRILHEASVDAGTRDVEHVLTGDEPSELAPDLRILPVPGHTRGCVCLLHDETHLFTGDHLAWSEPLGHLYAFARHCWYDWDVQRESMARLRGVPFSWVLPGHGRRVQLAPEAMQASLERCLTWMAEAR